MATREIRKIYFTRAAGRTGRTREVNFPYFTLCHQVFTYYIQVGLRLCYLRVIKRSPSINSLVSVGSSRLNLYVRANEF